MKLECGEKGSTPVGSGVFPEALFLLRGSIATSELMPALSFQAWWFIDRFRQLVNESDSLCYRRSLKSSSCKILYSF